MVWQDIVIALANVLFSVSITYQAYRGFREKKGFIALPTSSTTAVGLYVLAYAFFTLNLYLSTMVATFSATVWLILALQRIVYKKA